MVSPFQEASPRAVTPGDPTWLTAPAPPFYFHQGAALTCKWVFLGADFGLRRTCPQLEVIKPLLGRNLNIYLFKVQSTMNIKTKFPYIYIKIYNFQRDFLYVILFEPYNESGN